jgi:hypothetical protein
LNKDKDTHITIQVIFHFLTARTASRSLYCIHPCNISFVCMWVYWQDTKYYLLLFFFLCIQSVKYQAIWYVYTLFYDERRSFERGQLFFFGWMPINSNIRVECMRFSGLLLWDDEYVRVHLICFHSILSFFFYSSTAH